MTRLTLLSLLVVWLAGCNPLYVARSALVEVDILARRQPIDKLIDHSKTPPDITKKLALVRDARHFALTLGLDPGGSFTTYTDVGRDVLAWIVMAARPDAFELATWWYPFVGRVPYQGHFELEDARRSARRFEEAGYESSIRGTEAFSTLGWFNDPVLSTTLRHSTTSIVTTVIHEIVHSTAWVPGHVAFNESVANVLGHRGALEFFRARGEHDEAQRAEAALQQELAASEIVTALYDDLAALYRGSHGRNDILRRRTVLWREYERRWLQRYPGSPLLNRINNADLMQRKVYLTKLNQINSCVTKLAGNWQRIVRLLEAARVGALESGADPFHEFEKCHVDQSISPTE